MKDPNFEDDWVVLLKLDGMWVADYGYTGGKGTWLKAKHFMNVQDARAAIANPSWHNDPAGVKRAKPVRLIISVKPVYYPKGADHGRTAQKVDS